MTEIKGLPGAAGCVAGTAVVFESRVINIARESIADVEAELASLERARERYVGVLVKLADNADNSAPDQRVALPLPKRLTGDYRYAAARSLLRSALYGVPTATPLNAATGARVAALMRERTETGEHTKAAR